MDNIISGFQLHIWKVIVRNNWLMNISVQSGLWKRKMALLIKILFLVIAGFQLAMSSSGQSCCRRINTTLDCFNCRLTELPLSLMDSNITKLDLSYNNISIILPGSFEHMTSLKTLHLTYNPLHGLTSGTFRGEYCFDTVAWNFSFCQVFISWKKRN